MENQPDPTSSNKQEESTHQGSSMGGKKSDKRNDNLIKFNRARKRSQLSKDIVESVEHSLRMGLFKEGEKETQLKTLFETVKYSDNESLLNEPIGVKLSEVETQQIDWLWQRRVPLGKITLLDGDPGIGKSLLAITIAACVSTGRPMPDGTPGRQGNIIMITSEDSAEDTIKPRMEAVGCDPSCVLLLNTNFYFDETSLTIYERPFSLSRDMYDLEMEIKRTNAILVVIDP